MKPSTPSSRDFRGPLRGALLVGMVAGLVSLAVPASAWATPGASYSSLKNAIASGNPSSIIGELEHAEKLPCGTCIDLVLPLIDSENARVRDAAAWWLSKRAIREQVRDDMFERLQAGDTIRARNAAEVLGRFMHPDALMALEIAVHDSSLGEEARVAAALAIGAIGHPAGKAMLEGAVTSESAAVRAAGARALRNIRGNVEGLALVPLLADPDDDVVREAALTLGTTREEAGVQGLLQVVTDLERPEFVRRDAAWALGKIQDGSARDTLRAVAKDDPSMLVRGAARAASYAL